MSFACEQVKLWINTDSTFCLPFLLGLLDARHELLDDLVTTALAVDHDFCSRCIALSIPSTTIIYAPACHASDRYRTTTRDYAPRTRSYDADIPRYDRACVLSLLPPLAPFTHVYPPIRLAQRHRRQAPRVPRGTGDASRPARAEAGETHPMAAWCEHVVDSTQHAHRFTAQHKPYPRTQLTFTVN